MITSLKMKGLTSIRIYGNKIKIPEEEEVKLRKIVTSSGLADMLIFKET